MLYGHPPSVAHYRRFGCLAFVNIHEDQQPSGASKFAVRARRAIFVGYCRSASTIWRFYIPATKRIVEASSVTFDESRTLLDDSNANTDNDLLLLSDTEPLNFEGNDIDSPDLSPDSIQSQLDQLVITVPEPTEPHDSPIPNLADHNGVTDHLSRHGTQVGDDAVSFATSSSRHDQQTTDRYDLRNRKRPRLVYARHAQARVEGGVIEPDPTSFDKAIHHPVFGKQWKEGIRSELDSLDANKTWTIIPESELPSGAHVLSSKWVFKTKKSADGNIRHKARLVIRGYEQVSGIDFDGTFAPVAKLVSLRMLLALAARFDWEIEQLDVVTAFLNPDVDGEVYMELPEGINLSRSGAGSGFASNSQKPSGTGGTQVVKLLKALYGLKQAPRLWYQMIDQFLTSLRFRRCEYDPNVYISEDDSDNNNRVIILLYVDDLLLFSASSARIQHFKRLLKKEYRMTDLGSIQQFLGLEIVRNRSKRTITIT